MEPKLKPDLPEKIRAERAFEAAIKDRACWRCKRNEWTVTLVGSTVVKTCGGCGRRIVWGK